MSQRNKLLVHLLNACQGAILDKIAPLFAEVVNALLAVVAQGGFVILGPGLDDSHKQISNPAIV